MKNLKCIAEVVERDCGQCWDPQNRETASQEDNATLKNTLSLQEKTEDRELEETRALSELFPQNLQAQDLHMAGSLIVCR